MPVVANIVIGATAYTAGTAKAIPAPYAPALSVLRAEIWHPSGTTTTVIQEVGTTANVTGSGGAGLVSLNGTRANVYFGDAIPAHSVAAVDLVELGERATYPPAFTGVKV
jgi:hypothetical protein